MRFARNTLVGLAFATTSFVDAFAITNSGRSLHRLHVLSHKTRHLNRSTNTVLAASNTITNTNTAPKKMETVKMFFSSLFGGGMAGTPIDYTTLDYPGNEMGKLAQEGKVISSCERQPNLVAATFAGGCFWGLELGKYNLPILKF